MGECKVFEETHFERKCLTYEELIGDGCKLHGWLITKVFKGGEQFCEAPLCILEEGALRCGLEPPVGAIM
eukprot:4706202-Heterocapsa_arctica.AAC.1